ncbi:MAG: MBL fold metallo-hydrolase [Chloroflexaceae bacterium]|nr:MBL fold metallo-hydrolase [Chloroflexaceae bacterium]
MHTDQFLVRIWGARGSYPTPGRKTIRYGGNTTCVELQIGGHTLVIDAGTGIINLGQDMVRRSKDANNKPIVATILLTHMHHDHTQGFPYFLPAYLGSSVLHILGPRTFDEEIEEALNHAVLPPSFPVSLHEMPSLKVVRTLQETEMILITEDHDYPQIYNVYQDNVQPSSDMICIRVLKSYAHPRNGVYFYRIEWHGKSMVFASDTEGYIDTDQRLVNFARNTDLIIHDAQYTRDEYASSKQGWGHSTPEMACEVAKQCKAKQLVLFHHDPRHSDDQIAAIEQEAQAMFADTVAAYEGLEMVL